MARSGSRVFIDQLRKNGELIEIDVSVNPKLQVCEITDRISKQKNGGKALLFTKTGTDFPILINSLGSLRRIEIAFGGKNPDELAQMLSQIAKGFIKSPSGLLGKIGLLPQLRRLGSWMPKKLKKRGVCQEVLMENPDLSKLPILTCWPHDGGPFITLPLVHTIDPENGSRNLGMYRMQVMDSTTTGMHWHMHKTGARHYKGYKSKGMIMPVAVALGGDPVYTYSATAPLPDGIDEYLLAGYIRQKRVNLVKCLTQDIWVPEDADIIIEGYVDPDEDLVDEGPFGDHTGFYSLADYYPRFHVTCVTHRKNAVYPATIVGIPPQEDAWIALATEKLFLPPLKISMIPELLDMHMPEAGVAHNLALFSINHDYPGQGKKVLNSIWGAGQMMFNKFAVVSGADTDIRNYSSLIKTVCRKVDPEKNLFFADGPLDVLDHSADVFAFGGKLGFDATGPDREEDFASREDILEKMAALRSNFPEIKSVNSELITDSIPIVIITFKKSRKNHCREIVEELLVQLDNEYIPFWVFVDHTVNDKDLHQLVWIVGNHVDPQRDVWVKADPKRTGRGRLFIDATRKTKNFDGFERKWPNPVLMDKATIDYVDNIWNSLRVGPLIPSPSSYYRPLEEPGDAVVKTES